MHGAQFTRRLDNSCKSHRHFKALPSPLSRFADSGPWDLITDRPVNQRRLSCGSHPMLRAGQRDSQSQTTVGDTQILLNGNCSSRELFLFSRAPSLILAPRFHYPA